MPLFGAKKDPKFDKTNDPIVRGYKEFGIDENTKAMIYENAAALKKDKKGENPGIRWYLATVDDKGKFVPKDPKADKNYVYKLRAVKLERDNAGKFVKGKTSPRLVGKAHYIIEEEEVSPINFDFKKLDDHGIYKDGSGPAPGQGTAAPGQGTEAPGQGTAPAPGTPGKKGGKTRRRLTKSIHRQSKKNLTRKMRKIKGSHVPKKTIGNIKNWHHPIKYQKVKHH